MSEISKVQIVFSIENSGEAIGELYRIKAPRTYAAILDILPHTEIASIYKNAQISIRIPGTIGPEKATKEIDKGNIAYWPLGKSICVYYEKIEPYSPVNVLGKILEGLDHFKNVKTGRTNITIKKME
ncbi:MAG: cyclophilin-like fold protein [Promethearchaeota archaeon]